MNYSIFSNSQVFIGTINFIGIGLSVKWVSKCLQHMRLAWYMKMLTLKNYKMITATTASK